MIKLLKVATIIAGISIVTGCTNYALQEDLERLRAEMSELEAQTVVNTVKADEAKRRADEVVGIAESAAISADSASADAKAATAAANRAAGIAEDISASTNQKLDRLLNKAMMK